MDAYIKVGQQMSTQKQENKVPEKKERRESEAMKKVRKRANAGKQNNAPKKVESDADDIWDMNPEDFAKEANNLFG